ncbi:TIGR03016 family PEP-CTERM system-associated outer membrane protein [Aquisalimonas sp. APHAB1-3]|uniref:TIGR03016 family PEP-CTERM system-associated outer membrane protein n=1 Tax=Aquisalimonas sp. APHAB1-3 TaxID=3402080 RepID=UPI003AAC36DD
MTVVCPAQTQESPFSITPRLDQRVTVTDNVGLSPRGQESNDLIYSVAPGVLVEADGNRVTGRLDYSWDNRFYVNEDQRDRASHRLNTSGNAELVEDFLFLDARASRRQRAQTLVDPLGFDEGVGPDGTDVTTWQISPYVRQRLGRFALVDARYTYDQVRYGQGNLRDSSSDTYALDVSSGPMFGRYFWSGNFSRQEIRYDTELAFAGDDEVVLASVSGTAGVQLTPRLSVFGTVGEERNDFVSAREEVDGSFWSAGGRWSPSQRTSMEATYGERFFGSTATLDFQHRRRNSLWRASYSEGISTTRGEILVPDPFCVDALVDDGFTEEEAILLCAQFGDASLALTEDVFVSERAQVSVRYDMRRSSWSLLGFRSERDYLSEREQIDDLRRDERRTGVTGRMDWDLGPRTTSTTSLTRTWLEADDIDDETRRERLWSFRTGVTRQLRSDMRGSLTYRHQQRSSTEQVFGYRENAIIATLNMTF